MKSKKTDYLLWIVGMIFMSILSGCSGSAFVIRPIPSRYAITESVIQKDKGWKVKDKIAVIDLDGVIMNSAESGFFQPGENPVSVFCEKLDKVAADEHVKGVVIRINSPGGSVSGTELMYHKLQQFKEKKRVPVVASLLDVAASGGYYLACGCDKIYATPSTITGSIGTIMQAFSIEKTLGFIGIKPYVIKSGQLKDLASPFHEMRDDEKAVLQNIIDESYQRFLQVVNNRREITMENLIPLADGRVYTSSKALENKMIDAIGYPQDAVNLVRKQAKLKKCQIVMYHYPYQRMVNLYDTAESNVAADNSALQIQLPGWLRGESPQLLYLWKPTFN